MPILNYTTTVSVESTARKIASLLAKRGVRSVTTVYNANGEAEALHFTMPTDYGPRTFELPVRREGVAAVLKADGVRPGYLTREHVGKVAWRIAEDWMKAQLALVDAQMATLDEVMFPYMLTGDGSEETLYQTFRSRQMEIES